MGRKRKGTVACHKGLWYAKVNWTDEAGKRRSVEKRAANKSEALALARRMADEMNRGRVPVASGTVASLCDFYEERYAKEPVYVQERKVAGLRSWKNVRAHMLGIRELLGARKLEGVSYSDLEDYKARRLAAPKRYGGSRALATVHRELAILRRMFNIATREGWMSRNPFDDGDPLIQTANEAKREWIISHAEEAKLLAECADPRLAHLRAIIVCALDTGMRRGEILKLEWRDVDFERRLLTVRAFTTKTMRARKVGISRRLERELRAIAEARGSAPGDRPFPYTDFQDGWDTVRTRAGLAGLRVHDLRHSAASRLVKKGLSIAEVARLLGHTKLETTFRYLNITHADAVRAVDLIDELNDEAEAATESKRVH
jgi:integrase